ncbi:response regulator [Enhygromyxa salina]|uniref:response regulator n=1 Tax=Enhygromyxa salina TaxID=215803 RepID=UPI0011BAA7FF|nr:response regulator [Enhygromyxa salina]
MGQAILIVEDEAPIRDGICDLLAYHGHQPTGVGDGDRGLTEALTGRYALVILDVMLPGRDGFEICEQLRAARPAVRAVASRLGRAGQLWGQARQRCRRANPESLAPGRGPRSRVRAGLLSDRARRSVCEPHAAWTRRAAGRPSAGARARSRGAAARAQSRSRGQPAPGCRSPRSVATAAATATSAEQQAAGATASGARGRPDPASPGRAVDRPATQERGRQQRGQRLRSRPRAARQFRGGWQRWPAQQGGRDGRSTTPSMSA